LFSIKPALWVSKNLELGLGFNPKKQDYPDPIGRVDSVGYPEIWIPVFL
jgi:hypothetical protein